MPTDGSVVSGADGHAQIFILPHSVFSHILVAEVHLKVKAKKKEKNLGSSCCSALESASEKYFGRTVEHGVIDEQNELNTISTCWHFAHVAFPPFQLVLEAHNVPELSAGVNCTFEDLAEMDGLVEGNRITCSSPAEKEVPRIIVDQGVFNKHGPRLLAMAVLLHLDFS